MNVTETLNLAIVQGFKVATLLERCLQSFLFRVAIEWYNENWAWPMIIHVEHSSLLLFTVVLTLYLLFSTHRVVRVSNHQGGFLVHWHKLFCPNHK